jgi:LCP family protein required for cell wall assembly
MEENNYMQEPSPKRKLRWGRLLIIVVVLSALIASLFWGSVWVYKNIINPPTRVVVEMEPTDGQATSNKVVDEELGERINILLLGVDDGDSDAEADEPKRTDAILVLSVDPENEKVSVLSIPRDTKVVLPGHRDPSKINAAFAYGGAVMTKQTVQSLLQIPVHYYALANWRGFIEVVDLIGGVQLYVEKDMKYHDPYADLYIDIKQGYQHMNGETAGKYVRFRSDELGDIGRVQRQQKFLKAAAAQLFSFGNITKIGQIMDTIEKYIDTDLNTVTMIKAANSFKIFGEDKIKTCVLYGQFDEDDGISYWATNRDYVNKALDELEIPYKGKRKVKEEAKY